MGCCCGCPGVACSECSGTPDLRVFVSTSGITPVASGTCYNVAPVSVPAELDYSGSVQDGSSCLVQDSGNSLPCNYGTLAFSTDLFVPQAQIKSGSATRTTCASLATAPAITSSVLAYLTLASGVYSLAIYLQGQFERALLFYGTLTVASPPCRITSALTFTNSITPGTVYTVAINGTPSASMYAFASGGSATVVFKKSCCL